MTEFEMAQRVALVWWRGTSISDGALVWMQQVRQQPNDLSPDVAKDERHTSGLSYKKVLDIPLSPVYK